MAIVLSQPRAGNTVDVVFRGDASVPALSYRLVDAEPDALLCLRPGDNPALLPPDEVAPERPGDAGELIVIRLGELGVALPGLLHRRDQRNAFVAALSESLADWPARGAAGPAARLRAACAEAIARLPDSVARQPFRRKPARAASATRADEESREALFRALYYCRLRADGHA